MKLSHFSIDRPVATIVLSVFITVLGVIAIPGLGVREFPAIDPPTITVSTSYAGASADVIESQITEPIEESVNGVDGIRTITSTSREGVSSITVEFDLSADLDAAANDVRDRVSRVMRRLPADADPPTVAKADANSFPILLMTLQSDTRDILDVTDAGTRIKERLQTIPGVAEVRIWGEKRYAMRIRLDPERLAAHNLTLAEVRNALAAENVELPSGRIEGAAMELTVKTTGLLRTAEEFNKLVLRSTPEGLVRLEDVGRATLGAENERTRLKLNGKSMIGLGVIAQPGANSIAIGNEFYKRYELIKKDLPPDLQAGIGFDNTRFVRRSLLEVGETLIIAFALVLLVLFFFLRDWRSALLPAVAIPVSLIGSLFLLYVAGYTINVLTLLGLVLAIGLVVDDAIVVLENIYRKIEQGYPARKAGYEGLEEIFMAVVATTAVLAVVFLPLFFLSGFTGRLFREFGLAVAGSVILSAIVSLTLTPMMATRFLKSGNSRFYERTEPWFQKFYGLYEKTLRGFLHRRVAAGMLVLLCGAGAGWLFYALPSELAPREDRSQVNLFITGPEGFAYSAMAEVMDRVEDILVKEVPEADRMLSVTAPGFAGGGANSGFVRLFLGDPHETKRRPQQEIAASLIPVTRRAVTEARVVVTQDPTIAVGSRSSLPVQFVIQAPSFEKLSDALPRFLEAARRSPAFSIVDENLKFTRPEVLVTVNRDRLRALGVPFSEVAQALQLGFGETRMGYFQKDSRQYQVIGQVDDAYRMQPSDLGAVQVRNQAGQLIPLGNLIEIQEQAGPPQRFRHNRWVSATVSAEPAPGVSMGQAIEAMRAIANDVLDPSFNTDLAGEARDFQESGSSILFVFALAVILIYLLLAAQFESFRDPFVILLTVPLSLFGALLTLYVFGQSLNIFSQIGLVMLIGLVTKNGILIVEFTHQRLAAGLSLADAVVEASVARLRPILMTSLCAALGMVPIALALGAGAESRRPMGIAVVGGLLFGMVLTLYVIPAMVLLFGSKKTHQEAAHA